MTDSTPRLEGWREQVLKEFPAAGGEIVLVGDPDGLLGDEFVQTALAERGYEVVTYDDPIVFRAMYERDWRRRLESGGSNRSIAIVVKASRSSLAGSLPYDVLHHGRTVHVSLATLFMKLAPSVVCVLGPEHLDALWEATQADDAAQRGPESSQDFLLRAIFGIDITGIVKAKHASTRLLVALLQMHFRGFSLPPMLAERAIEKTKGHYSLNGWPLGVLFGDRAGFLAFLQRQWEAWVARLVGRNPLWASDIRSGRGEAEKLDVSFNDTEVVQCLEPYFLHGLLVPVPLPAEITLPSMYSWIAVGVEQDPVKDALRRLEKLLADVKVPTDQAQWSEWTRFSTALAEASGLRVTASLGGFHEVARKLDKILALGDAALLPWLQKRYGSLASLPSTNGPVMVHHTARFMASRMVAGAPRVALLVMDGLALDQWVAMRSAMPPVGQRVTVDEGAAFAWIPTLTNVSRQAIFAGNPPWSFPTTIQGVWGEEGWWRKFWDGQGVPAGQVRYLGGVDPAAPAPLRDAVDDPSIRVIGAVVTLVDHLIHKFPLPRGQLIPVLTAWSKEGHLSRAVALLLEAGFEVFMVADHGNVDAIGRGKLDEGKVPDIRGQRVRVYPSEGLCSAAAKQCPDGIPWPGVGLPSDFHVILAPTGRAFIAEGEQMVCHGGPSMLEVLVPFVHFRRVES